MGFPLYRDILPKRSGLRRETMGFPLYRDIRLYLMLRSFAAVPPSMAIFSSSLKSGALRM